MMNRLLLLCCLALFLGCSGDDSPSGTGFIAMKIDGVYYKFANIGVGYTNITDQQGNPAVELYMRGTLEGSTFAHAEYFVFIPYRSATLNHYLKGASHLIKTGINETTAGHMEQDDPLLCVFTQNDTSGFKGTFSGTLYDGPDTFAITEGVVDITYGSRNYGPGPGDGYDPN